MLEKADYGGPLFADSFGQIVEASKHCGKEVKKARQKTGAVIS